MVTMVFLSIVFRSHSVLDMDKNIFWSRKGYEETWKQRCTQSFALSEFPPSPICVAPEDLCNKVLSTPTSHLPVPQMQAKQKLANK